MDEVARLLAEARESFRRAREALKACTRGRSDGRARGWRWLR
jgi:hypothetical protein